MSMSVSSARERLPMMGREGLTPSFICGISHLCERRPRRLAVGRCVSHARAANDRKVPQSSPSPRKMLRDARSAASVTVRSRIDARFEWPVWAGNDVRRIPAHFPALRHVATSVKLCGGSVERSRRGHRSRPRRSPRPCRRRDLVSHLPCGRTPPDRSATALADGSAGSGSAEARAASGSCSRSALSPPSSYRI